LIYQARQGTLSFRFFLNHFLFFAKMTSLFNIWNIFKQPFNYVASLDSKDILAEEDMNDKNT